MRLNNSKDWYHVILIPRGAGPSHIRQEFELNLSIESIERRFLVKYRRGRPMVIKGKTITTEELERLRIFKSGHEIEGLNDVWSQTEITQEFITDPPGSEMETVPTPNQELTPPADAREVFVVHGRNLAARDALFDFLRAIDLRPLEWAEAVQSTGRPSPYIGEILSAAFSKAHAVVVLMTPDDDAQLRKQLRSDHDPPHETKLSGQARPNVLFEAGMAMGRNENRTILVELGTLRPFSDIAGRHVVRLGNTTQRRQELAQRLEAAGCPVNLEGTDWHEAGDFAAALDLTVQTSTEAAGDRELRLTTSEAFQLSEEAQILLIEATKGESAFIQMIRTTQGMFIRTNGKALNEMGNRRSEAKWEGALDDLLEKRLVRDYNGRGTAFEVTHKGFEFANSLGSLTLSDPKVK